MSEPQSGPPPGNPFADRGGTMRPGSPTYIIRDADRELYDAIKIGTYCSVLTTRQMGKSSLMARTAERLRQEGTACATVDLQGKGDAELDKARWYYGVVKQIRDGLVPTFDLPAWWRDQEMLGEAQRFTDFLAEVVLRQVPGPVVIFIDEVDWTIRLPFSDEFFAAIRSCFNRRATDPAFDRLTFVLLGAAAPAQLIKDPTRTPFNIGSGIELTDFTSAEAARLAPFLDHRYPGQGAALLARVLYWTDGHPYLTQMLCGRLMSSAPETTALPAAGVDTLVEQTLLSSAARTTHANLSFTAERLAQAAGHLRKALATYRRILRGEAVPDQPQSLIHAYLRLSGVVKPDAERFLRVRNRIYQTVFNERWIRGKLPRDYRWMASAAAAIVLLTLAGAYWYGTRRQYNSALATIQSFNQPPEIAYQAYDLLKRHDSALADEQLARFFERIHDRDRALMIRARSGDIRQVAALAGLSYSQLVSTIRGHGGPVFGVAWSPDGKRLASGSADNTARIGDSVSGRPLTSLPHSGQVGSAVWSPDGKRVATGSSDAIGRIFDSSSGRLQTTFFNGFSAFIVAWSPDGKRLATGTDEGTAQIRDSNSTRLLASFNHPGRVRGLAWSPDGKRLATGSTDNRIRIWDSLSARPLAALALDGAVYGLAWNPNGRLLASGSLDGAAHVWDSLSGRRVASLFQVDQVGSVSWSPDGKLLAVGSGDGSARIWDGMSGREAVSFFHDGTVQTVAWSPDGRLLATGSNDGTVRLWAADAPQASAPLHNQLINAAWSRDGKFLAASSHDGVVRLWDNSGRQFSSLVHKDQVHGVAWSPDGKLLATGCDDGAARIWDIETGREMFALPHNGRVRSVAWSDDGRVLASGSFDRTARTWDTSSGRLITSFPHSSPVLSVAWSPASQFLATGAGDGLVRIWDNAGRATLALPHRGRVRSVAWGPGGKELAVQSELWVHLYKLVGSNWQAEQQRYFPTAWPNTLRLTSEAACSHCLHVTIDTPADQTKLLRVDLDQPPEAPEETRRLVQGKSPAELVAEWGRKLALHFNELGHIVDGPPR